MGIKQDEIVARISALSDKNMRFNQAVEAALRLVLWYFEPSDLPDIGQVPSEPHPDIAGSIQWLADSHLYDIATIGYLRNIPVANTALGQGLVGYAIQQDESFKLVNDIWQNKYWRQQFRIIQDERSQSALAVLLILGGRMVGGIYLVSQSPNFFREGDVGFVTRVAPIIMFLLQNLRLKEREAEISAIAEISMAIKERDSFDAMTQALLQAVNRFFSVGETEMYSSIHWIEDEKLVMKASDPPHIIGVLPIDSKVQNIAEQVVETGDFYLLVETNDREQSSDIDKSTHSIAAIPIFEKGNVCGVLYLACNQAGLFRHDRLEFLNEVAHQAAIAKDYAELKEKQQRSDIAMSTLGYMERVMPAINHQVGQPLGIIYGSSDDLIRWLQKAEDQFDDLKLFAKISKLVHRIHVQSEALSTEINRYKEVFTPEKDDRIHAYFVKEGIEQACAQACAKLEDMGVNLEIGIDCSPYLQIRGNKKLTSHFRELIINAGKYLGKGRTAGELHIMCSQANSEMAEIKFIDTGDGIEPKDLEKVFMAGFRAENAVKMNQGSGWGLPGARLEIGALGGEIWAESDGIGKGSTFVVMLPLMRKTGRLGEPTNG